MALLCVCLGLRISEALGGPPGFACWHTDLARDEAQKQVAAAKAALEKANNPDQTQFFPYLTGYVAFHGGDYKTAITELRKASQVRPVHPGATRPVV